MGQHDFLSLYIVAYNIELGRIIVKKILLLGATGFIGKNLKEYFDNLDRYSISAPTRENLDLLNEDMVTEYLKKNNFDIIINAAIYNPLRHQENTNHNELEKDLRAYYILEKLQHTYGKMYYLGSGAEYNKDRNIGSVSENEFLNGIPTTEYGFAKYIIGRDIEKSCNIYNLRIFGLFGKYENWRKTFISGACCKALKNVPITIRQNVIFDYLYIDDFCRIIEWFIEHEPKYHTYNVTSGKKFDLVQLANLVNEVVGTQVPIYVCKKGMGNEYTASNKRIQKEIEGFQVMDMKESIAELCSYYKERIDEIDLYSLLYQ